MAKKFLKSMKEVKRSIGKDLVNAGCRYGSTVGTAFLSNAVLNPLIDKVKTEKTKKILKNVKGPGFILLGTAIDVFVQNDLVKSAGQGMGCYGALEAAGLVIQRDKIGLSGIKGNLGNTNNQGNKEMFDRWAKAAEEEYLRQQTTGGKPVNGDDVDHSKEEKENPGTIQY